MCPQYLGTPLGSNASSRSPPLPNSLLLSPSLPLPSTHPPLPPTPTSRTASTRRCPTKGAGPTPAAALSRSSRGTRTTSNCRPTTPTSCRSTDEGCAASSCHEVAKVVPASDFHSLLCFYFVFS